MNSSLTQLLLPLGVLAAPAVAMPDIEVRMPYNFMDSRTLSVEFPVEMVSADAVGKPAEIAGLRVEAPLQVEALWESRSHLRLNFSGELNALKLYELNLPASWVGLKGEKMSLAEPTRYLGRSREIYTRPCSWWGNLFYKPYYFQVDTSTGISDEQLAPYMARAYCEFRSIVKGAPVRRVESPARPLRVGDVLKDWDYFRNTLMRDVLSDADKARFAAMDPAELIPGYWMVDPVFPQGKERTIVLSVPDLGRRAGSKGFEPLNVSSFDVPIPSYMLRNEYLGAGRYRVTLDFALPIKGSDAKALAQAITWQISPYAPKEPADLKQWSPEQSPVSISLDEAATQAYFSQLPQPDGQTTGGYHKLVFAVDTKGMPYYLDASAEWETMLGSPVQAKDLSRNNTRTRLAPPTPHVKTFFTVAGIQAAGKREIQLAYRGVRDLKGKFLRLDSAPETTAQLMQHYDKLYQKQSRGYTLREEDEPQASILPAQLLPHILEQQEQSFPDSDLDQKASFSPQSPYGLYLVELCGKPSEEWLKANPEAEGKLIVNQNIVQLTDLGLMWKQSSNQLYVYAYQLSSGKPIKEGTLRLLDTEGKLLKELPISATGATVDLPTKHLGWLQVASGEDCFTTEAKLNGRNQMGYVSGAEFTPYIDENALPETICDIFTDRNLYRPGELVHLGGTLRDLYGNVLRTPKDISHIDLTLCHDNGDEVSTYRVEVDADGSFSQDIPLPKDEVGSYSFKLKLVRKGDAEGKSEDQVLLATLPDNRSLEYAKKRYLESNRSFSHYVRVADYRRNEFELSAELKPLDVRGKYQMDVLAMNFNGTPLSGGGATWHLESTDTNFYPKDFKDYRFGDHRLSDSNLWLAYYCGATHLPALGKSYASSSESLLDAQGRGQVQLERKGGSFPRRQSLQYACVVRKGNGQRLGISKTGSYDPADVYVGLDSHGQYSQSGKGKSMPLDLVLVDTEGNLSTAPQDVSIKVTREKKLSYRLGAFSRSQIGGETIEETILECPLKLEGGKGQINIPMEEEGEYIITVSGQDAKGQEFRSAITHRAWEKYRESEDRGLSAELRLDKDIYQVGDTAKLLLSDIPDGTVLVSIEREKILRQFTLDFKAEQPIIEVPLEASDAPGVKVHVFSVQGAETLSPAVARPLHHHASINLKIDPADKRLSVDLQVPQHVLRVGEECDISGQVKDAQGNPVPSAKLFLYAVDEGNLQAGDSTMPDPIQSFYGTRRFTVKSFSSLLQVLSDKDLSEDYGNKGIFIGGGHDGIAPMCAAGNGMGAGGYGAMMRSDFSPCAFWKSQVSCDEQGRFSLKVDNPDLLTRYRLIAVAKAGDDQFGVASDSYEVSRAIMLEPSAPLAATLGDVLDVPVTISMNPKMLPAELRNQQVTWSVQLQGNDVVQSSKIVQTIDLQGDEPKTLIFPVDMKKVGAASFTWTISPASGELAQMGLSDGMLENFIVNPPTPYLREAFFAGIPTGDSLKLGVVLNTSFNAEAKLDVTLSPSPLASASMSIEMLQSYPYECSEQLSSRLWPLMEAELLHKGMGLSIADAAARKEQIQALIRSLRKREFTKGCFSYWPEQQTATPFNASIWMTLARACKLGYINKEDWDFQRSVEFMLRQMLKEGEVDEANSNQVVLTSPLNLLCIVDLVKLDDEHFRLIIDRRAADKQWHSAQAKYIIALAAYRLKSPKAEFYYKTAQSYSKDKVDVSLPSCEMLKLLIETEIDAKSDRLATAINEAARRYTFSTHRSTYDTAWMVQLLARYIEKSGVGEASCHVQGKELTAIAPLLMKKLQLAEMKPLKVEQGKAYAFGMVEGYTKVEQEPQMVDKGFRISRRYERLMPDGQWVASESFKLGDVVRVKLSVRNTSGETGQYIAIEDIMPAGMELINPAVTGQALPLYVEQNRASCWSWGRYVSYKTYLKDRLRLFVDSCPTNQAIEVSYMARVVKSGHMTAPAAKAEMMYQPLIHGLSIPQKMVIDAD